MLFRDGADDWVTGKVLDDIIKLNEYYNLEQGRRASAQEWNAKVHTTIKSYGYYCVRGIVPSGLLQKKSQLEYVEPPKVPHKVGTNRLKMLSRGGAASDLAIDEDDADAFFETAQGTAIPLQRVVMSQNKQGEAILQTSCPTCGSLTYT
jgi:hypothetical protein